MHGETFASVEVLGTRFHRVRLEQLLAFLVERAASPGQTLVCHVNVHALNLAHETPWFRDLLNGADLVFCDGFGALVGAALLGQRVGLEERMTCPDFLDDLARAMGARGLRLFLLAGQPGVVEAAMARLRRAAPALEVDGHHGHFAKRGPEDDAVVDRINAFRPDVLFVGFGMPLQERWLSEHRARLDARVLLPLGACLDYYTGRVARAPRWASDRGLEWLGRLLVEPRRLGARYLVGNPLFLARVLGERARRGLR